MHSSLSLVHLLLAVTRLGQPLRPRQRLATIALGGMSLSMVFLTATRTAALTLAVFALLHVATAGRPSRALAQVAAGGLGSRHRLFALDDPGQ